MKKEVLSFDEYSTNEQVETTVNTQLGQAQDSYEQIKSEIDDLWQDISVVGGTGVNKVGVQTNLKKQIAEQYRLLADALITLADQEFNKAKYEEDQKRIEDQEQLQRDRNNQRENPQA
jgi:hypothetical protein